MVSFAELTDFEWDRMAFVQMHATNTATATALEISDITRPEFEDWIVFLLKDKMVHHVTRTYDPEVAYNKTLFFDFGDRQGQIRVFPKEESIFKVIVDQGEGIVNIDLQPLD